MSLILSIETSTTVCSVSITHDGAVLVTEKLFLEKSHSSSLTLVIRSLIEHANIEMKDLDAIAVSKGPGSYTGLRIGVSTAKGLCYALDKPLIAINTLQAMAYNIKQYNTEHALLCPMIDARRMEVYTALYDHELNELEKTSALILNESSFDETLKGSRVLFFGNGARKFIDLVGGFQPNARYIDGVTPPASAVGALAEEAYLNNQFEDVAYFEPFYLKDFMATVPKKMI